MVDAIERLEQEHAEIEQRLAGRRRTLEPVAARLSGIPVLLVDVDGETADELFAEYRGLQARRDRLLLECTELAKRAELAGLAVLAAKEQQARDELEAARAESTRLKRAAEKATRAHRAAISGTIPDSIRGNQDAIDLLKAKTAGKKATAWALSTAGHRAADRARARWQLTKNELERTPAA